MPVDLPRLVGNPARGSVLPCETFFFDNEIVLGLTRRPTELPPFFANKDRPDFADDIVGRLDVWTFEATFFMVVFFIVDFGADEKLLRLKFDRDERPVFDTLGVLFFEKFDFFDELDNVRLDELEPPKLDLLDLRAAASWVMRPVTRMATVNVSWVVLRVMGLSSTWFEKKM